MMKELIHSEEIIVKYKDSMILPRAKESEPQERGIETRNRVCDNEKESSIQTIEKELLLKSSTNFDKGDDISDEDPFEDDFEELIVPQLGTRGKAISNGDMYLMA